MLKHRKDCPATWGFIKRWWKICQHRKGLNFSVILFTDVLKNTEWRYTVRDSGWLFGGFKTEQEAIDIGKKHFARVWRFGNDWGVPLKDLCNCFDGDPD